MASVGFPTLFVARDTNGDPVSGAKCYFYETGTSTPLTVYSDVALTAAVSAPQIADSSGIFASFYTDGSTQIKIDVFDASDVRLPGYPLDPIDLEDTAGAGTGAGSVTFTPTSRIVATNVQDAIEEVDGTHLKAVEDARTLERLLITTAGSSNAYTAAATGYTAYTSGDHFYLLPDRANTGAATLNIESVGAKDLQKYDGAGSLTALVAGDIQQDTILHVRYDGTKFAILNPITVGQQQINIPAGAMNPTSTNGAAAATEELATNDVMKSYLAFDDSTRENACFDIGMPPSWDLGTFVAQFRWYGTATSGDVIWGIEAVAVGDDDAQDASYGTAVEVTDTANGTANDINVSSETAAITAGGTPAAGDTVQFKVYRDAADGSDTFSGDAKLIEVRIHYNTKQATES